MPIIQSFAGISSLGFGVFPGGALESIATVTVGSGGASSIEFTSIPSTYQHLQIRGILRYNSGSTGEALTLLRFNGDSTNSYAAHILYGTGSSAAAYGESSTSRMWGLEAIGNGITSSVFAAGVLDILDYTNTSKNTTLRGFTSYDANGSGAAILTSGVFQKTDAITSVAITPNPSYTGFAQHSTVALYGVKAP